MRLFLIARHGQSTLNVEQRVNGDPGVRVDLTEEGRADARALGEQIANVPIGLCVHTRFDRTRQTAELALEGRDVPFEAESLLDDIDVGDLEGETIHDYRLWKHGHTRADPFPGGESLDDAARRYAAAYRKLLERETPDVVLIVCHEIPLRYALNAAVGSNDLDGPMHEIRNATPYLFDEPSLTRAAERIKQLAG
jgi:ribonuclease H / adenosylcobalamin/alpha-ribazole phosphatase